MTNGIINYLCGCEILKELINLVKDEGFKQLLDKYQSIIESDQNIDSLWSMIITTFLMNEKLCMSFKIDDYLDEDEVNKSITEIIEKYSPECSLYNGGILGNYFLDENNKIINNFYNLIFDEYEDFDLDDDYKLYGCNSGIIIDEKLDYHELIRKIRNSFAHSSYEIIDSNYIRLYHKNGTDQYDFNVLVSKPLVLTIIDEINKKTSEIYQEFISEYENPLCDIRYKFEVSDEEIIEHLLSFKIMSEDKCWEILSNAKQIEGYNQEKEWFNKIQIIFDLIYQEIETVYPLSRILSETIYNKLKDDEYFSEYLYYRSGYYQYDQMNFDTKEEKIKLLLLTFFNIVLLYGYNSNENNDFDFSNLDFSTMDIDEDIKNKMINERLNIINNLDEEIQKEKYQISKTNISIYDLKDKKIRNDYIENEYFIKTIPSLIEEKNEKIDKSYEIIRSKKEQQYEKLFEIENIKENNNLNCNIAMEILEHLRNSFAHGRVYIAHEKSFDNILDAVIYFEDYHPITKNITFKSNIKLIDLFNVLLNEELLCVLFQIDKKEKICSLK